MKQWLTIRLKDEDLTGRFSLSKVILVENDFVPITAIDLIRYKKDTTFTATVDAWGSATSWVVAIVLILIKRIIQEMLSSSISHQVPTVGMTFNSDTLVINV